MEVTSSSLSSDEKKEEPCNNCGKIGHVALDCPWNEFGVLYEHLDQMIQGEDDDVDFPEEFEEREE